MPRAVLLISVALVAACGGPDSDPPATSDPTEDCAVPGLEAFAPVSDPAPVTGDVITQSLRFGGCENPDGSWGVHLTDLMHAEDGALLCAVTHGFTSTEPADGCGLCDVAWVPVWSTPDGHGSSLCEDLYGFDPSEIGFDFYDGVGVNLSGGIRIREEGGNWEPLVGEYDVVSAEPTSFLLVSENTFVF